MGYKKVETRAEIKGFWTRDLGVIELVLGKKVTTGDNSFYVGRLLTDAPVKSKEDDGTEVLMTARRGDTIGISATAGLMNAFDDLPQGQKFAVRLTCKGKKPNKRGGGEYWDIDVEVQPASEAGVPF